MSSSYTLLDAVFFAFTTSTLLSLQYFDTVDWTAVNASGLWRKVSVGMLMVMIWLELSADDLHMFQSFIVTSATSVIFCYSITKNDFDILELFYLRRPPGCLGILAVKWM